MPQTILEMREAQARIRTNAQSKYDEITPETPEARAAEIEREFDSMMATFEQIGRQIDRRQRLDAADAVLTRAAEGKRPRQPDVDTGDRQDGDDDDGRVNYRTAFARMLQGGMGDLSAEDRAVLAQGRELVEGRAQSIGTNSAGGFTVPVELVPEIEKAMAAWGPMYDATVVREITTPTGAQMNWPTVDDTAKTGRIKAENATVDDDGSDDVVFGSKALNAYIYDTGMVKVPMELLDDSVFNLESLMNDLFGERLGRLANEVLTTADGSGKPHGIVTASAEGIAGGSATAFTADETLNFFHSVDPAYRQSPWCRWQFNDQTLLFIKKLKDGDGNYLWQMGDVRSGEPNTFHGKPYSINQAMAGVATGNRCMIFGDHSRYIVRKVRGFTTVTLRERYAERFQIGMVGFKRFDGELLNTAAVKHFALP